MPEVIRFEEVTVTGENLGGLLRAAAAGRAAGHRYESLTDPTDWARRLADLVVRSPLRDALEHETSAMLLSEDETEVALARQIQDVTAIVDGNTAWDAAKYHVRARRFAHAEHALGSLLVLHGQGRLTYDPVGRDLLVDGGLPEGMERYLLILAGAHDRTWLVSRPEVLLGATDDETTLRVGGACLTLGSVALEQFRAEWIAAMLMRGHRPPPSTMNALTAMADARRSAGR